MSGNETSELKKTESRFLYFPLALRVFLSSLPFMILGIWFISGLVREQTHYEAGLIWIKTVQMVEKEAFRFEELIEDEQLTKLDLKENYEEQMLPEHETEASTDFSYSSLRAATYTDASDVQLQYLYNGSDAVLKSLDVARQEEETVPEDTEFYKHVKQVLTEDNSKNSITKFLYRLDHKDYYVCIARLEPTKPVCCGNMLLSDGTKGSKILISGQFCYDAAEQYVAANRWNLYIVFIFVFFLFIGILCYSLNKSLRRLVQINDLMQNAVNENLDFSEIDMSSVDMGTKDEIHELLENFQLMFLSIRNYQETKTSIRQLYDSLLPAAFLALFRQEDIRKIRPGDVAVASGIVLSVQFTSSVDDSEVDIEGRNRLIIQILNLFESMNMIVTELEYDHISALKVQEGDHMLKDNYDDEIRLIQSMYREGSGVDDIIVTKHRGEFCYTVTGITGNMRIHMEQISDEEHAWRYLPNEKMEEK